jgi:hypothetical protein
MPLIVQKFGGTSVANPEKILKAARRAIRAQQEGNQVIMVVSAMGHSTDELVDLAKQITDKPPAREMDMLLSTGEQVSVALVAMAIQSLGHKAVSMTGAQIGIKTVFPKRKIGLTGDGAFRLPYWIPLLISAAIATVPCFPWRHQFSRRTLLIGMTLAAIGLGWLVYAYR